MEELMLATRMLHMDDDLKPGPSVAPDLSLSTTFQSPRPKNDLPDTAFDPRRPDYYVYSRYGQASLTRAESLLGSCLNGYAIMLSSGLAAVMTALMHYQPPCVAITQGYHGCHVTIDLFKRLRKDLQIIDLDDKYPQGTMCWLETPLNPTGECRDIQHYADKVHAAQGKLFIDATFGPPPLQDPFRHGADLVMHSATKYLAGHSDALIGVLCTKDAKEWEDLWHIRTFSGNTPGSLEVWLLMRSLRTLEIRVKKQARTATLLAQWLDEVAKHGQAEHDGCPPGIVAHVWHASLQARDGGFDPMKDQLADGPACFAILLTDAYYATWLPHTVKLLIPATSLGGVESLIERRRDSDANADPCLIRLSIGLEDVEDLKNDFRKAFAIIKERKKVTINGSANGTH